MHLIMICRHPNHAHILQYGRTALYQCADCRCIFTPAVWKTLDLKELYKDFYQESGGARFNFGIEYLIKAFRFNRALRVTRLAPKAKTILDIGSGRGFMLYFLRKYFGYTRAVGTQISQNAFRFSRDVLGLEMYDRDLLELSFDKDSFDAVTLWHVLEHLQKPEECVERISGIIKDRGALIIEVPNFNSWTRALTGQYWLGLEADLHVYHFTRQSLTALLQRQGFAVRKVRTFSLEYSAILSAQSIVSKITRSDHLFLAGIQSKGLSKLFRFDTLLLLLLLPLCFVINLLLFFSDRGEVLFVAAEKKSLI